MMNELKGLFCASVGAAGSLISAAFGGWSGDMTTLLIFMTVDFVMGLCVAGIFKNSNKTSSGALDSRAGWKGLCRKGITWLIVLVARRLDIALGIDYIKSASVIGFTANEALSIMENAGLMGIKLPKVLANGLDVLLKKGDYDDKKD